jgi:pyruvate dehydrogenase complex dehydrogenase (E1) component
VTARLGNEPLPWGQRPGIGVGGDISTYASLASLYEVGFQPADVNAAPTSETEGGAG